MCIILHRWVLFNQYLNHCVRDAMWRHRSRPLLEMLLPGDTKLLPEPILNNFQWGLAALTRGQFYIKCSNIYPWYEFQITAAYIRGLWAIWWLFATCKYMFNFLWYRAIMPYQAKETIQCKYTAFPHWLKTLLKIKEDVDPSKITGNWWVIHDYDQGPFCTNKYDLNLH